MKTPLRDRLIAKIKVNEITGCWEWTGYKMPNGYARIGIGQKGHYAHRVSYETFVGPIPPRLTVDHLCRVRHCINPSHLEVVTNRVNILRGNSPSAEQARWTHCRNGHALTGDNLSVSKNGKRRCVACNRKWHRQRREKYRNKINARQRALRAANLERYREYDRKRIRDR